MCVCPTASQVQHCLVHTLAKYNDILLLQISTVRAGRIAAALNSLTSNRALLEVRITAALNSLTSNRTLLEVRIPCSTQLKNKQQNPLGGFNIPQCRVHSSFQTPSYQQVFTGAKHLLLLANHKAVILRKYTNYK